MGQCPTRQRECEERRTENTGRLSKAGKLLTAQ
jgi:hypothetical protein